MEPLEPKIIARIALFQVVSLVYGVLACAVTTKIFRTRSWISDPMNYPVYWWPHEFCELGWLLFLMIVIWTSLAAYFSVMDKSKKVDPAFLFTSGIILLAFMFIVPSFLAFQVGMCSLSW